jgi:hydroxymethylpyrimidine pyrophosphatase-like HAD family hydrolase
MNISIDFDHTYTADPKLWQKFIKRALKRGHNVYCVSARYLHEAEEVFKTMDELIGMENCFITNRKAKQPYMLAHNIAIDVWIDDTPTSITQDK